MRTFPRLRSGQQGATLIILLVMLVIITLLTVTTVRTTAMDEKMAGNARDRNKAFQAAEAAVQTCLTMVNGGLYTGPILAPVSASATPSTPHWEDDANWTTSTTKSIAVTIPATNPPYLLAENPRCMVEALGAAGSFRVTGRAVGGSADSVVMLQATYSPE